MMKQFGGEKSRLLKLGPIVGAPPRDSSHARPAERTQPLASAVPEPLSTREGDIHMTAEAWRSLVKVEQTHRIFFTAGADEETDGTGDLDADDRLSEIEGVKMPTKFWRHKPTGRVGLDRFRKAVDFVLIAKQLFTRGVRPNLTAEESILFFMDIPSAGGIELPKLPTSSQLTSSTLQTTPYKALKEQTTVSAVKSVLETLPAHRTEEQITATIQVLQGFSKFIGYPQHVQKGICQHGWYASFDPHRILCRQDQDAEIYYFILSGLAISRSLDQRDASQDNRRRQRAQFLRKGDVIGEKEILQNCCRESTVITKETVEVLGLDKQDFLDIFRSVMMQGESTVNFLKDMDVFSDFPTDLLHAHQYACSLHSFRRGAVIVHNSNESEWVYIIKEGSCQVYKAIKSRSTVKEKKKRTKIRALSDDALMIGEERRETTDLYLPSIVSPREIKKQLIPARDRFGRRKSLSEGSLNLPAIAAGDEKRLTSRLSVTSDSGTHSEDEVQARKKKHVCTCINKREKKLVKTLPTIAQEPKTPTKAFAKLEVLTTKGVFGMHSLVYDDTPSLTLVSNGSTCILISKQFLSDHMTGKLVNTLKQKLPPYPSVANLQTALDDQASWSSYKQKVVHDTIIP